MNEDKKIKYSVTWKGKTEEFSFKAPHNMSDKAIDFAMRQRVLIWTLKEMGVEYGLIK